MLCKYVKLESYILKSVIILKQYLDIYINDKWLIKQSINICVLGLLSSSEKLEVFLIKHPPYHLNLVNQSLLFVSQDGRSFIFARYFRFVPIQYVDLRIIMSYNSNHVEEHKALLNLLDSSVRSPLIKFFVWLVEVAIFELEFK